LALEFFGTRILAQKAARKMLMKLTAVVNFINVLRAAFVLADPESAKKTDNLIVFLCFWDLYA